MWLLKEALLIVHKTGLPFHIQITELVKHLSVRRQHALSENIGGVLWRWCSGQYLLYNLKHSPKKVIQCLLCSTIFTIGHSHNIHLRHTLPFIISTSWNQLACHNTFTCGVSTGHSLTLSWYETGAVSRLELGPSWPGRSITLAGWGPGKRKTAVCPTCFPSTLAEQQDGWDYREHVTAI